MCEDYAYTAMFKLTPFKCFFDIKNLVDSLFDGKLQSRAARRREPLRGLTSAK